jgi:hypothetical protein
VRLSVISAERYRWDDPRPQEISVVFDRIRPADTVSAMASGLNRVIDGRVPSNRFVLMVTPLAGVVAGGVALAVGDGLTAAARAAISGGGTAFLAWAIAREVDPDTPLSACVAAIGAPWLLLLGYADLFGSALLLLGVRVLAGTTGSFLIAGDVAFLVAGAALAGTVPTGPAFVTAATVATVAAMIFEPTSRPLLIAAAGMAAAGGITGWLAGRGPVAHTSPGGAVLVVLAGGAVAGLISVVALRRIRSTADREEAGRVSTARIRMARVVVVLAGVVAWLWTGDPGVPAAAAAWVALTAVVVVFPFGRRGPGESG